LSNEVGGVIFLNDGFDFIFISSVAGRSPANEEIFILIFIFPRSGKIYFYFCRCGSDRCASQNTPTTPTQQGK
jgi:hypothetical protein